MQFMQTPRVSGVVSEIDIKYKLVLWAVGALVPPWWLEAMSTAEGLTCAVTLHSNHVHVKHQVPIQCCGWDLGRPISGSLIKEMSQVFY